MIFAFLGVDIFVFFMAIFFEIFVVTLYIPSIELLLLYKVYGICFPHRNNLFVLARRIAAIALLNEAIWV